MGPPPLSEQPSSLVSRFDRHIGNEPLVLPACEILPHSGLYLPLAGNVAHGRGAEERLLSAITEALLGDPLDAIEPFLENVTRPRYEI